jgi:tetratricopeptide (TPR) repeat protein
MRAKTTYSVMVSSTYIELVEHRRAIVEAMLGQRLLPIAMEYDAALPDQDLTDASLAKVDEADAYVGLISYRYGQMPECPERNPDRLSLTELEFRRAIARGIPICMFIMHRDHLVPSGEVGKERGAKQKLRSFLNLAKNDRIYAEFKSVDDLKTKAVQSLVALREALDRRAATSSSTSRDAEHKAGESKRFAISNILISVPLHFLGRDDELEAVDAALKGEKGRIAALHGLRGVGKSTLAVAYAERHRSDYRTTWWIRAQTPDTMRANLVALGVRLGWVAPDEKEEPALATVRGRLRDEGEGLLLIYDNAIDAASLRPYLPPNGAARVLVTSNSPAWRGVATPVEIRVWPKEVGADYLIARTGHEKERAEAEALSQALGGLTLAHEQAAAYCERVGVSFAEYRKRFTDAPARLLDAAKDVPPEYGLTVAKAFSLAIDEAAKLHPAAEPVITCAALLAPEPIPMFLFSEARETFGEPLASQLADDGLDEAVAALRAFALVDRETIPDERDWSIPTETIRLHRLVRAVAAGRLQGEAAEDARRVLIEAIALVYPSSVYIEPDAWPRARRIDALALDLVGGAAPPNGAETSASYLLDQLGSYRRASLGAYSEARPLFESGLAIRERALGTEHPDTATSLNNLANLLRDQGDLAGAWPLFERALAIREKALGPEHPDTATSLNDLAHLFKERGYLADARPLIERALTIYEKALGPEHPWTAATLGNLAFLLQAQGDLVGARRLYERVAAIDEKVFGADHPEIATDTHNLAGVLYAEGDPAGARRLFERALAIREKALGSEHPSTNVTRGNLAHVLLYQGALARAKNLDLERMAARLVAGMAGAAVSPRAGRQRADEIDLGEELYEIAGADRARLHEIAMLVAAEAGAHEDVEDIVDMRLGLTERQLHVRREGAGEVRMAAVMIVEPVDEAVGIGIAARADDVVHPCPGWRRHCGLDGGAPRQGRQRPPRRE